MKNKMKNENKLKPFSTYKIVASIIICLISVGGLIWIRISYGEDPTFLVGAYLNFITALWFLFLAVRTKNLFFIFTFLFLFFLVIANFTRVFFSESVGEYFLLGVLVFGICTLYVFVTKKIKSRDREILELAAKPVNETNDGFTPRPYVSGQIEFSQNEINLFSNFLLKHLIALPYREENKMVLLLEYSSLHLLFLKWNYSGFTHITFQNDGTIVVYISKKSYLRYKDELTFDQLCESLGDLFKGFFDLFKNGNEHEIIKTMNKL